MAQGALTLFNAFTETIGDGTTDLDTHTFKMALITNAVVPAATDTTPQLSDYTEVSGTGYTAGGETLTVTWTRSANITTWTATGSPAAGWSQNGAGPTNIYYGIIYDDTAAGDDCIAFIDMTTDGGTTPLSLQDGDIAWSPNASGIFQCVRA